MFLLFITSNAFADKFWVGGTGNSNDPTNHWATTTGGSPGAGNTPTAADNCIFDASSGTGTVTLNAALACRSFQSSGSSVLTLVHNSAVTVTLGDATAATGNKALDLSGFTTYTLGSVTTSAWSFISTSVTLQTMNFGGFNMGNMTFTGASQKYAFVSNLTTDPTTTVTLTGGASSAYHFDGTSDISALTNSIGKVSSNNSNVLSYFLGNSALTLTGTGTVWDMGTTANHTLTQGSSGTLTTNGNAAQSNFGGANCSYRSITQAIGTGTETNGGTFVGINGKAHVVNWTITGQGGADDRISLGQASVGDGGMVVSGAFTITGATSVSARITLWPSSQANVKQITTSGATINFSYVDIQDISFVSTSNVDFTGITGNGAVGDAGGNTITGGGTLSFLSPTNQHWLTASTNQNWSTVGNWTSRIPLAQDNVLMDVAFTGSPVITADRKWLCHNIDWSGGSGNVIWQGSGVTSSERYTTGNIKFRSGVTWAGNSSIWQLNCRGICTYTDNSVTKSSISKITVQAGNGGDFLFQDTANMGTFRLYGGIIDFNNQNISAGTFEIGSNNSGNATIWNMGSGTTSFTATGNILFPTIDEPTNYSFLTVNNQNSTIAITNTTSSTKTFKGGTFHWHFLSITGGGTGAIIFTDGSTWDGLPQVIGGTKILTYTVGTTNTFTGTGDESFGNGSNIITINSSSAGTPATLSKPSGFVRGDFLSLKDSAATGGASWFAGANSTNVSGNSGWIFRSPSLASIGGRVRFGGVRFGI